jgi:hypothetical protein
MAAGMRMLNCTIGPGAPGFCRRGFIVEIYHSTTQRTRGRAGHILVTFGGERVQTDANERRTAVT